MEIVVCACCVDELLGAEERIGFCLEIAVCAYCIEELLGAEETLVDRVEEFPNDQHS